MQRKTIFGGEYKFYTSGMEKDMSGAGSKVGPGPANLNIRINPSNKRKKSSTIALGERKLGETLPTKDYPSAAHYYPKETINTIA
jgi:hypothetical protein